MTPDLSRRVGRAFTTGAATPAERETLIRAVTAPGVGGFETLPAATQAKVIELETRGRL